MVAYGFTAIFYINVENPHSDNRPDGEKRPERLPRDGLTISTALPLADRLSCKRLGGIGVSPALRNVIFRTSVVQRRHLPSLAAHRDTGRIPASEHFNRKNKGDFWGYYIDSDFEAELRALIDKDRAAKKRLIVKALRDKTAQMDAATKEIMKDFKLRDLSPE